MMSMSDLWIVLLDIVRDTQFPAQTRKLVFRALCYTEDGQEIISQLNDIKDCKVGEYSADDYTYAFEYINAIIQRREVV